MLALYRRLLSLYPAAYRLEFGEEMTGVFREAQSALERQSLTTRGRFCLREFTGLLGGALREHWQAVARLDQWELLPLRRFPMRSQFRYPNVAIMLMTIIFLIVVALIEKGLAISASLPHLNPALPPIQPAPHTVTQTFALGFAIAWAAGVAGWALLVALRRSGAQRLSDVETWPQQR